MCAVFYCNRQILYKLPKEPISEVAVSSSVTGVGMQTPTQKISRLQSFFQVCKVSLMHAQLVWSQVQSFLDSGKI